MFYLSMPRKKKPGYDCSMMSKQVFLEWRARVRKSTKGESYSRDPVFGREVGDLHDVAARDKDWLVERATNAAHINKFAWRGLVVVRHDYTDCDGYSGTWWNVIPATLSAYRALHDSVEEGADGTYYLSLVSFNQAMKIAPQRIRDRLMLA